MSGLGIAIVGVFTTLMVQHGPVLADQVVEVVKDKHFTDDKALPNDTTVQGNYPQLILSEEEKQNNETLLQSMECMQSLMDLDWQQFIKGLSIRGVICDNGNLLYQVADRPDISHRIMFRAVSGATIIDRYLDKMLVDTAAEPTAAKTQPALFSPRSPGDRMTPIPVGQAAGAQLLCQRRLADGRGLFQRLKTPNGCIDQVIDTWTGKIIDSRPGPCQPC